MDIKRIAAVALSALILFGCQKKSKKNYLWGYLNPGDFRPYGIAPEKRYSFSFTDVNGAAISTLPAGSWKSCNISMANPPGSNNPCNTVFANWINIEFNPKIPNEGVALNDDHTATLAVPEFPIFSFKMTHVPGTPWTVSARINGISYINALVPVEAVTITDSLSSEVTLPACPAPTCAVDYASSLVPLRYRTIAFTQRVQLSASTSVVPSDIYIEIGDIIVAQDYSLY